MHILCPHCRNPIEVVKISAHEEIACPSCGSSFRLEADATTDPEQGAPLPPSYGQLFAAWYKYLGLAYPPRDPDPSQAAFDYLRDHCVAGVETAIAAHENARADAQARMTRLTAALNATVTNSMTTSVWRRT